MRLSFENVNAFQVPSTVEEWLKVSQDFEKIWQFPHVLAALDGKHIRIKNPNKSGSMFFNFKHFNSIVLFAAVDAHGKFLFIDVGCNGKASDSSIFQDSELYKALKKGSLKIPSESKLFPGAAKKTPYFFIGDDAFALDAHVMKPFSRCGKLSTQQQVFNYRMCRARIIVGCTFGRYASRFRIFNRLIELNVDNTDLVVLATCALHNYLTKERTTPNTCPDLTSDALPDVFSTLGPQIYKSYKYACRVRDDLSKYFMTDGSVDFQWSKINL